jgi:hypothetical protein
MKVHVESYSGYRGNEEPRAIELEGRRVAVIEVVRQWQDVGARCFRVRADDGKSYVLRYVEHKDEWYAVEMSDEAR